MSRWWSCSPTSGDHLSYYQDAVATEAYLGTARKRISVRRHARLLDYFMHDGANARTWLFLEATADNVPVPKGRAFATKGEIADTAAGDAAIVFETMHDARFSRPQQNYVSYLERHRMLSAERRYPRHLKGNRIALALAREDLLLLEEILSPTTGNPPTSTKPSACRPLDEGSSTHGPGRRDSGPRYRMG